MVRYAKISDQSAVRTCTNEDWSNIKKMGGFIKISEDVQNVEAKKIMEAQKKAAKEAAKES